MASLKNIKLKIVSVKKTSTVTRAMEAVSAVKMRKAQERALGGRTYAASALSVLERLSNASNISHNPLMQPRAGKTALVLVTSDKGLAGALNSGVIRKVERELESRNLQKSDIEIFAFGRRGADYFANRGYTIAHRQDNANDAVAEADLAGITQKLIERSEFGTVLVAYQNFISTFEQIPTVRQIVPIEAKTMREFVEGIHPVRGRYAPSDTPLSGPAQPYTIEPNPDTVLAVLLPKLLTIAIFHSMLESKASEHSARMVAMKNATDNAKTKAKEYTRLFNKVRQAAITREISEITSGIEAMK